MKTKEIKLDIPVHFKWLCIQPWGEYLICVEKPVLFTEVDDCQYWEANGINYLEIDFKLGNNKNWAKSLKKI